MYGSRTQNFDTACGKGRGACGEVNPENPGLAKELVEKGAGASRAISLKVWTGLRSDQDSKGQPAAAGSCCH